MSAKAIIFLRRRPHLSAPQFQAWWLNDHKRLAEQLPGLVRHTFNVLPDGAPYDAVVEQWFATPDALASCYASPEGRAVAADSAAHTSERIRLVVDEHAFPASPHPGPVDN